MSSDQTTELMGQLREGLRGFSDRWSHRADKLEDFFGRWERAWNTHELDALEVLVTEDIVCEDPAMLGETVHGRREYRAFCALLFRAFPDVHLASTGTVYLAHKGTGMALPWRLTGTFTGELALWGERYGAKPPALGPTGRTVDIEGVDLYEFRDGLISRHTLLYDPIAFSRQAGLLPSALERKAPAVVLSSAQRLIAPIQRRRARARRR